MTVNERLYHSGLFDEYDLAEKTKDVKKLINILNRIEIGEGNVKAIIEELGLKYEN